MEIINLTKSNSNIKIKTPDGISEIDLPKQIVTSIELRGKKAVNFRIVKYYSEEQQENVQEIQVLCSKCRCWTSVYRLVGSIWEYVNSDFRTSAKRKTGEMYFADKCLLCYGKKDKGIGNMEQDSDIYKAINNPIGNKTVKNKADNDRVQQTVFLSKDNEKFIRLYCAINNVKKNKLLNDMVKYYKESHPLEIEQ
jgi:archaellin